MTVELAQVNIARLLAPLESPQLRGFVEALEPVNALADAAPGFRWRLQTEDGDATGVRAFVWDVAEAEDRVRHLREHGPTPYAFTLHRSYPSN